MWLRGFLVEATWYQCRKQRKNVQKQPSRGVLKKAVLKRCSKFAGELPCWIVIEIALAEFFFIRTPMEGCFKIFKNLAQNSQKTYQDHLWISFNTLDNLHSWKTQYTTAQKKNSEGWIVLFLLDKENLCHMTLTRN